MTPLAAVTGATGFVGRHVTSALAAAGWRMRLLVRRDPLLETGPVPVELVPGTLGDRAALRDLVRNADAVIHLGGMIKAPGRDAFMAVNAAGTEALAQACRQDAPQARFIMLSSLAARAPHLSDYAASKAAGEAALDAVLAGWTVILRPGAIYGPGDRETLRLFQVASFGVQPMLNNPGARLTLVHVHDVAGALVRLASGLEPTGIYELSDARTEGYSWREIAAAAAAATGARYRPVRVPAALLRAGAWWGDMAALLAGASPMLTSKKLREIQHQDWSSHASAQLPGTVWRPEISLEEGFAATVSWYRSAGWLPSRGSRA